MWKEGFVYSSSVYSNRLGSHFLILTFVFLSACLGIDAPQPGEPCTISEDQLLSFSPRVEIPSGTSIQVGIDSRFSKYQQTEILSAIEEWNTFSRVSLGMELFEAKVRDIDPMSEPQSGNDCSTFIGGSPTSFDIIRADHVKWEKLGLTGYTRAEMKHLAKANRSLPAAAVTIRCTSIEGNLQRQAILLNHEHPGRLKLKEITLHELGHALGLSHSCRKTTSKSKSVASSVDGHPLSEKELSRYYVGCDKLHDFHPYLTSVMAPIPDLSMIPSKLQKNDMQRAYCHYAFDEGMGVRPE